MIHRMIMKGIQGRIWKAQAISRYYPDIHLQTDENRE
jgi:hypothetical protein